MTPSNHRDRPAERPRRAIAVAALSTVLASTAAGQPVTGEVAEPGPPDPRQAGLRAAEWLLHTATETEHGLAWAADPTDPKTRSDALYSGSAGAVLLLIEAHAVTGEPRWAAAVGRAADHLAAVAGDEAAMPPGLYTGRAGIGYALAQAWRVTGAPEHREAAARCAAVLCDTATPAGAGVEWNHVTDIIGGGAGIGLWLLQAAAELEAPRALQTAVAAGRRLLELDRRDARGRWWPMSARTERHYPNFSHGTAGVAYYLATLHAATGDPEFLAAAVDGAAFLASVERDGLVHHHEPGGEDLFYLGWCHGPAGTTRLYQRLAWTTGDATWSQRLRQSVDGLTALGVPGRHPGLWDTVGQCCGTAGIGEMLLQVDPLRHAGLLDDIAADLLARATTDADGLRWVQAEHRVRPQLRLAQTGYMQGAAGVGLFFLHLDGARSGRPPRVVLPDSPYRR